MFLTSQNIHWNRFESQNFTMIIDSQGPMHSPALYSAMSLLVLRAVRHGGPLAVVDHALSTTYKRRGSQKGGSVYVVGYLATGCKL
jgi:hypothetical protein